MRLVGMEVVMIGFDSPQAGMPCLGCCFGVLGFAFLLVSGGLVYLLERSETTPYDVIVAFQT